MEEKRPTHRRWFQFSLRTFLVVITFVGFGGAWVGMQLQQKRRHEAVVIEILKLGGKVEFRDSTDVPKWKEWLFGSYAEKPFYLNLNYANATDSVLAQTQGMNVFSLGLSSTKVTDSGLAHMKVWTSLEVIALNDTQVTDAGLTHLEGLPHLEYLDLNNTQVTQAGVDKLQQAIPNCEIEFSPIVATPAPALRDRP